jgi:D-serine deaminase-like pyridoxal phosphate-dependent protein
MAPAALLAGTSRPWREVERMLESGKFQGQLSVDDLPTPALLLDLDAFESNVTKMAAFCKAKGRALRPHGKTHKCPEIARRLIAAGAAGACAAKLSEAEVFARNGVSGLLITGAVIGQHKIERAISVAKLRPETIFCVDHAQNAADLNDAARAAGIKLNFAIDLYVGNRTGIPTGQPALSLAQAISKLSHARLAGLQSYAGHAAHRNGFEARKALSVGIMQTAAETRRMIEAGGIPCPLLTGGSTGTYNIDCDVNGVTELQPGSFIFMDIDYARIGGQDGPVYRDFRHSLTVLTTVVSKPSATDVVVDGGLKAFSTDKPFMPEARGIEGLVFSWGGDEHGKLNMAKASRSLSVGDRVEFVIPHCDPTVNLYDRIFGVRGKQVETSWRIAARGMSQ